MYMCKISRGISNYLHGSFPLVMKLGMCNTVSPIRILMFLVLRPGRVENSGWGCMVDGWELLLRSLLRSLLWLRKELRRSLIHRFRWDFSSRTFGSRLYWTWFVARRWRWQNGCRRANNNVSLGEKEFIGRFYKYRLSLLEWCRRYGGTCWISRRWSNITRSCHPWFLFPSEKSVQGAIRGSDLMWSGRLCVWGSTHI